MPAEPVATAAPTRTAPGAGQTSGRRLLLALAIAASSDCLGFWMEPALPAQWGVDLATAVLLFLVLRRRRALLPALVAEAIPGLGLLPFWLLVVLSIAVYDDVRTLKK